MTISKANRNFRGEIFTDNPKLYTRIIEESGFVKQTFRGNVVIRYILDYGGKPLDVRILSNRIVILSPSERAVREFGQLLQ